jgi:trk system potassium uptake protein TrkA
MAKRLGCKSNLALINNPSLSRHHQDRSASTPRSIPDRSPSRACCSTSGAAASAPCTRLQRGGAEIIEAEALETSPLVGTPLRDLDLPDGMRIGAVYRDGGVIKPSGSLRIKPKDRVVIFALEKAVKQVEQMFRSASSSSEGF